MKDKYGTEIVAGALLVTEERTGPVPGRIWLGIAVQDDRWPSSLVFQSANMTVVLHPEQCDLWQVVLLPQGIKVEYDDDIVDP